MKASVAPVFLAVASRHLPHFAPMCVRVFPWLLASVICLSLVGCADDDDGHGFTEIQLLAPLQSESDAYVGTSRIRVKLDFIEECLAPWYAANPDYLKDGIEGAPIFEEWQAKLCDVDVSPDTIMECSVASITHTPNQLMVEYDITGSSLAARVLPFGPIPCERLTGCPSPTVIAQSADAVQGFAGTMLLWNPQAWGMNRDGGCEDTANIQVRGSKL